MTDPDVTLKLNELVQKGKDGIETCQEAVNKLTLVVQQNIDRMSRNSALQKLQSIDRSKFSKLRSEFKEYINNINDQINSKAEELRNVAKQWNNCVSWNDTTAGRHNDWCANDHGGGWYHSGAIGNCTSGYGRGECKMDDNLRNRLARDIIYGSNPHRTFSTWLNNIKKFNDTSECKKSNWQCISKSDNSNKGTMRIGWGHTAGDGEWACNAWVDACKPDKCKVTEIQDVEGKHGPVCTDGQANIDWTRDTDDQNYPDIGYYPYDDQVPILPDVQCCTNINAVMGEAKNIAQECQQTLTNANEKIDSPSSSPPSSSPPSSSPPRSFPPSSSVSISSLPSSKNTNTAIIGGVVLILLLCICSIIGIIGIMFLGDEEA